MRLEDFKPNQLYYYSNSEFFPRYEGVVILGEEIVIYNGFTKIRGVLVEEKSDIRDWLESGKITLRIEYLTEIPNVNENAVFIEGDDDDDCV